MAGFKGQVREPRGAARARRNSQNLTTSAAFIGPGSVVIIDGDGFLQTTVDADKGLQNLAGELGIKLATSPGLSLAVAGLSVDLRDTEPGLELTLTGLGVLLSGTPGLEYSTGLQVKLNGATLQRGASGLSVATTSLAVATTTAVGVVLRATTVANLALVVTNPPTQAEVQAVSDKVDALLAVLRTAGLLAP